MNKKPKSFGQICEDYSQKINSMTDSEFKEYLKKSRERLANNPNHIAHDLEKAGLLENFHKIHYAPADSCYVNKKEPLKTENQAIPQSIPSFKMPSVEEILSQSIASFKKSSEKNLSTPDGRDSSIESLDIAA